MTQVFSALHMSINDKESTESIDFGVTDKLCKSSMWILTSSSGLDSYK